MAYHYIRIHYTYKYESKRNIWKKNEYNLLYLPILSEKIYKTNQI